MSAAKWYCDARDEVTGAKEVQANAKLKLIKAMNDAEIDTYDRDGFVVTVSPGAATVDVKRAKGS